MLCVNAIARQPIPIDEEYGSEFDAGDRAPVEITSKNGRAVLISADEWEAWQETAYLFRSPANARRLLDAAAALDAGRGLQVELDTAE